LKKILLIAVMLIGTMASAQAFKEEKAGVNLFYSSNNSVGLEVVQSTSANPQTMLIGLGASWAKNSADKEGAVFTNVGYDFGQIRLVSRLGLSTDNSFLYGGYAGINVTKRVIFNAGYDTKNEYTTGLTFILN
jgi:opacity protein-like surface antigen